MAPVAPSGGHPVAAHLSVSHFWKDIELGAGRIGFAIWRDQRIEWKGMGNGWEKAKEEAMMKTSNQKKKERKMIPSLSFFQVIIIITISIINIEPTYHQ